MHVADHTIHLGTSLRAVLFLLATGCQNGVDTMGDASNVCEPGQLRCSDDLSMVEECAPDATGWIETPCSFECLPSPTPHCPVQTVSNVPDPDLLLAGERPTIGPFPSYGSSWRMQLDTDTGSIRLIDLSVDPPPDLDGLQWRPPGEGLDPASGIHFTTVEQGEGLPGLGVFSFWDLALPHGFVIGISGSRPLVVLSEKDVYIYGGVDASCHTGWFTTSPAGGSFASGEGPGGGRSGSSADGDAMDRDGGGGGGAFGGDGGDGGKTVSDLGGLGGAVYGTETLVPLQGGSGGGAGRIRLNGQRIDITGDVLPPVGSPATTQGTLTLI